MKIANVSVNDELVATTLIDFIGFLSNSATTVDQLEFYAEQNGAKTTDKVIVASTLAKDILNHLAGAVAQFSRRVAGANSYGFTEDMFVLKVRQILEEQLSNLKSSKLNKRRNAITSVQKILCKILADYELYENAAAFN